MSSLDAKFIYKDEDGVKHQETHHFNDRDKMYELIARYFLVKINLIRVTTHKPFTTKVLDSYNKLEMENSVAISEIMTSLSRDNVIDDLLK